MDLRALVVDDEQLARDELCFQLEQLGGVAVVGQAGNGLEALESIERLKPEVVFLDVQMPGLTGFEVARRVLERQLNCHLVFVTAFDQYAIEAFEVNAVDYLLKPVEPLRLDQAVQRARRWVEIRGAAERAAREDRQTGWRPAAPRGPDGRQGWRTLPAGPSGRHYLCLAEWRYDNHSDRARCRAPPTTGRWTSCRRGSTPRSSGGCTGRTWSTSTKSRR